MMMTKMLPNATLRYQPATITDFMERGAWKKWKKRLNLAALAL